MRRDLTPVTATVAIATVAGGLLRFATLDAKGLWQDEVATLAVIGGGLGDVFAAVTDFERTPPLYYLVAWAWTQVFGEGEVGLRSLSAVAGTATIPLAYVAGRELVSRRAGVVAAVLVAVSPLLIWYSQEGRAFALLVALCAAALVFFGRAWRGGGARDVALWTVASALAVATHYFATFLFLAEAAWLVSIPRLRRAALAGAFCVAAAAAALIPLAAEQQSRFSTDDFISGISLASRAAEVPGTFLVGFEAPYPWSVIAAAVAAGLVAVALILVVRRGTPDERRGATICASIGAAGVVLPLAIAAVGLDVFYYRNVLAAELPLAIVVAAGFAAARAGRVGLAAGVTLACLLAAISLGTASEPKYGRESWREAAEALGEPDRPRAIVSTPRASVFEPLGFYLGGSLVLADGAPRVAEIDVLALRRRPLGAFSTNPQLPEESSPASVPRGFELAAKDSTEDFLLLRFEASKPSSVTLSELGGMAIGGFPAVLFQAPDGAPKASTQRLRG